MDALAQIPLTMTLMKCALAAGTTTTISSTGTIHYLIKGIAYTKAALSNTATPTTDATTGSAFTGFTANNGTVVVIGLDSSGNVKASQGPIQALDVDGNFIVAPQFPAIPDTICPIGYIVLKGGSTLSGTFTFGSSNLSGVTGMTYTFDSVGTLPDRPKVS
jgi:hypothetical protein